VRRERLLPALDHETSDEDISSLKNGSELKAHTAEAEDRWKVVADLYQRQVQAIAASQDLTGAPQVLDRRITFQGLSAPVKLAVLYKGNFQDGNAQILAVDGESVSSSLKGKIRIRISADGLRTVFFLLWGARSRGAMWHGYYNVPEGFIFREQALFETITNREEKDPLDPSLDTVLRVHAGFRITRCGERFRISCLGYRTNVGICDYWVEVDGDGWIADDGEIVLLKTSIRMFY
jgi:hypothetical protein